MLGDTPLQPGLRKTRRACVLNPFPTSSSCLSSNRRSRATDPLKVPHDHVPSVRSRACERVVEPEIISTLVSLWQRLRKLERKMKGERQRKIFVRQCTTDIVCCPQS
jgi:hypothetical protein